LGFKFHDGLIKAWAEQFLRIDLHQKEKEESGKYLGNNWTGRTGKSLMKCFHIHDCITRLYNSAGSNACRPMLIHPVLMSIIFEHYKQLDEMRKGTSNGL